MSGPLTPERLAYGVVAASDPWISPDGTRIAYTVEAVDGASGRRRTRVWSCAVDGADARPLTPADGLAAGARWSPDGRDVALTSAVGGGTAIRVLRADSGDDGRELTRHRHEIGDLAWSPDGSRIAYTTSYDPDDPDEREEPPDAVPRVRVIRRLDYKQDGRGYLGDRRTHVFVVDVASGVRRRVTTEIVDHHAPRWSPDGRRLAAAMARADQGGSELVLLDAESGAHEGVSPPDGIVAHWAWSPTGDRVLYAGDPDHALQLDYFLHDVATAATRRLTDDLGAELEPDPAWLDERHVLFHAIRAGASGLELLDVETGSIEPIARWPSRNSGLSVDGAGRRVVQAQTTLTSTPEIMVFDREAGQGSTITDWGAPLLAEHPPALWERLEVPHEGLAIDAWLLKPPGFDPRGRYPVVLDVHGGPTGSHGCRFMAHQQCLATHGFLVVSANPRGSSSYGRDFAQQVVRDWGGGDFRDLMAVLDAVVARPYADGDRTGIFGISYGGYMTAWAISHTDRFKAAVCGEPIFDLESDYGTSDVAYNGLERHGGGPPHAEREWYTAHSPSTFAHRTRTPTLLFHGEADERCPIGQSEQMFVALKKAGCEVEYVRYPGGSHMFFVVGPAEHRADFLARTLAWFRRHLGPVA